jgi:L-cystine transport system permease protein
MDFDFFFLGHAFLLILPAVPVTLFITVSAIASGFTVAVLLAYVRYYRAAVFKPLAEAYISFFRGTPIVMHFFFVFYGLPHFIDHAAAYAAWDFRSDAIPLKMLAVIALTFSSSAYFAEILRAGISAVDKGEIEAAYAVGMTHWQAMRRIILPQALVISIPSLGSRCIGIMHSSSLAFWICVLEVTAKANLVASDTYQFMEAFLAAAAIYWLLTLGIERIVARVETWSKHTLGRGVA